MVQDTSPATSSDQLTVGLANTYGGLWLRAL